MNKSEMLLGRLLEERLTPNADVADVDRRLRALFEEEWCVLFTDMAGFSRHSPGPGIIPILCLVHELRRISRPIFEQHGGHVVKIIADSFLVLFRRPGDALAATVGLQRALAAYNEGRAAESRIEIGAGLGFGRMLKIGDDDVFGVEVNFAARLGEDLAEPGEILATDAARAALVHSPGIEFEPISRGATFEAFSLRYDAAGR